MLKVTIWGARGSIPVPGPETARYGGNTSCVSIENGNQVLVLDAGTGIRALGASLLESDREIYILLTHIHADHVQGFPFFGPLYQKDRVTTVLDHQIDSQTWSLAEMLDGVLFPLQPDEMPGHIERVRQSACEFLAERGFQITRERVHHPGGAFGYRVESGGQAFVYIPDNELSPPRADPRMWEQIASFCRGASVLVHDCQYVADDIPLKWGWGHSTLQDVCRMAIEAEVGHLVLFHHDPARTDHMLDEIEARAKGLLDAKGITCTVGYEGLALQIGGNSDRDEEEEVTAHDASSGSGSTRGQ